jgi:hypothetical protein
MDSLSFEKKPDISEVLVLDAEYYQGRPYIISWCTKNHGLESYIVRETLDAVPHSTLTKIDKPHFSPTSL